jgi:hypothetical protein
MMVERFKHAGFRHYDICRAQGRRPRTETDSCGGDIVWRKGTPGCPFYCMGCKAWIALGRGLMKKLFPASGDSKS